MNEIEAVKIEAEDILLEAETYKIDTEDECRNAVEILKECKRRFNFLDTHRKKLTKPIDESKKNIMDTFRPTTDVLKKAETLIKDSIVCYVEAQNEKIREIEKDIDVNLPACKLEIEGVIQKKKWDFKIIDREKIPAHFWTIDKNLLKKFATTMKDKAEVSGIEFYCEDSIAIKVGV